MTLTEKRLPDDPEVVETCETSCCIVVGGPAGLMMATLLARKRVPVVLLEEHQNFDRDFRGDTVHPSTLDLLDQLGWADELLERPHGKVSTLSLRFGTAQTQIADFRMLATRFPYIALIAQADFLSFIHQKATQFPDLQVEMGAQVLSL